MDPIQARTFLSYYILSGFCIFINIIIVLLIFTKAMNATIQTPFLYLTLFLHISIIGDVITALPNTFNGNTNWCLANESWKFYFGLMNIMIIFFNIQAHRFYLFTKNPQKIVTSIEMKLFAILCIFFFPCISFLPYIEKVYDLPETAWCVLTYDRGGLWVVFVQYFWVFCVLLCNIITILIISKAFISSGLSQKIFINFLLNVVIYTCIASISWVPRFYELWEPPKDDDDHSTILKFYQFFPINIAGILYAILFVMNRRALLLFARLGTHTNETLHFETNDLLSIVEEGAKDGSSSSSRNSSNSSFVQLFSQYFRFSSKVQSDSDTPSPISSHLDEAVRHGEENRRNSDVGTRPSLGRVSLSMLGYGTTRSSIGGGNNSSIGRGSIGGTSSGGGLGATAFTGSNSDRNSGGENSSGPDKSGGRNSIVEFIQELRRDKKENKPDENDGINLNPLITHAAPINPPSENLIQSSKEFR